MTSHNNPNERMRRANAKKMNVGMMTAIAVIGVVIFGAVAYIYTGTDSMTASSPRMEQSSPPTTIGQSGSAPPRIAPE